MSVAPGLGTRGGFPGSLGPRQGLFRGAEGGELAEDLSSGFLNCQTVRTVTWNHPNPEPSFALRAKATDRVQRWSEIPCCPLSPVRVPEGASRIARSPVGRRTCQSPEAEGLPLSSHAASRHPQEPPLRVVSGAGPMQRPRESDASLWEMKDGQSHQAVATQGRAPEACRAALEPGSGPVGLRGRSPSSVACGQVCLQAGGRGRAWCPRGAQPPGGTSHAPAGLRCIASRASRQLRFEKLWSVFCGHLPLFHVTFG